jgi:hypothetical protein
VLVGRRVVSGSKSGAKDLGAFKERHVTCLSMAAALASAAKARIDMKRGFIFGGGLQWTSSDANL